MQPLTRTQLSRPAMISQSTRRSPRVDEVISLFNRLVVNVLVLMNDTGAILSVFMDPSARSVLANDCTS